MELVILNDAGHFWQWDTGQKIRVMGCGMCDHAVLSNGAGCAPVRVGIIQEKGCDVRAITVPDTLLQQSGTLCVFLREGATTRHVLRFPVVAKSKPTDYVYTPEEVKTWDGLAQRITDLEQIVTDLAQIVTDLAAPEL